MKHAGKVLQKAVMEGSVRPKEKNSALFKKDPFFFYSVAP